MLKFDHCVKKNARIRLIVLNNSVCSDRICLANDKNGIIDIRRTNGLSTVAILGESKLDVNGLTTESGSLTFIRIGDKDSKNYQMLTNFSVNFPGLYTFRTVKTLQECKNYTSSMKPRPSEAAFYNRMAAAQFISGNNVIRVSTIDLFPHLISGLAMRVEREVNGSSEFFGCVNVTLDNKAPVQNGTYPGTGGPGQEEILARGQWTRGKAKFENLTILRIGNETSKNDQIRFYIGDLREGYYTSKSQYKLYNDDNCTISGSADDLQRSYNENLAVIAYLFDVRYSRMYANVITLDINPEIIYNRSIGIVDVGGEFVACANVVPEHDNRTTRPALNVPAPTTSTPTAAAPTTPTLTATDPTTPSSATPVPTTPTVTTAAPITPALTTPATTTPTLTTPATTKPTLTTTAPTTSTPIATAPTRPSSATPVPTTPTPTAAGPTTPTFTTDAPTTPALTTPATATLTPTATAPTTPALTTPAATTLTPTATASTTPALTTPATTTLTPTATAPTTQTLAAPFPIIPALTTPATTTLTPTATAPTTPTLTAPFPIMPAPATTTPAPTATAPSIPTFTTAAPTTPAPTTADSLAPARTTRAPAAPAPTTPASAAPAPTTAAPATPTTTTSASITTNTVRVRLPGLMRLLQKPISFAKTKLQQLMALSRAMYAKFTIAQ